MSSLKHDFTKAQQGEPLTFMVMLDKVINLSPTAISSLKKVIENFDIKNAPGEDISVAVRCFLYTFKRLESNGAIDATFVSKLYDVFQTTSVAKFNDQVAYMKTSSRGSRGISRTYKEILDEVLEHYQTIWNVEKWTDVTPLEQDSVFLGGNNGSKSNHKETGGGAPGPSPFSAIGNKDRVCGHPERFQRIIKGSLYK